MAGLISVSLAFVASDGIWHYLELDVPAGATIDDALMASGWLDLPEFAQFASWRLAHQNDEPNHKAWYVGIYSQKKRFDTVLADGDRVEIYRALSYDPMSRRKQKSKSKLKAKSAKA